MSPLKQPGDTFEIQNTKQPKLAVLLDKVSDPQNVGAIIRSSLFFNCNAIINTYNGGSSENGSPVKAARAEQNYIKLQTFPKQSLG